MPELSLPRYRSRFLVIGASNVRRSLLPLISLIRQRLPAPIDLIFACGHGRSFGRTNRVMLWSLPGLCEAAWRERWNQSCDGPRYAIITDLGNDLMYEFPMSAIAMWFDRCVESIGDATRSLVMGLPLESASRLGPAKFFVTKKIFFPSSRATLETLLMQASSLEAYMRSEASRRQLRWLSPSSSWYGVDPIHIRRGMMKIAWNAILNACLEDEMQNENELNSRPSISSSELRLSIKNKVKTIFSRAETQRWWHWELGSTQPWIQLEDGSTLSFY